MPLRLLPRPAGLLPLICLLSIAFVATTDADDTNQPDAGAPAPPAAAEFNPVTDAAVRAAARGYFHALIVDTYRARGEREDRWDEQALAFLEAVVEQFSVSDQDRRDWAGIRDLGTPLVSDLGCTDPQVQGWYGWALQELDDPDIEAVPYVAHGSGVLVEDERFPLMLRALTARNLGRLGWRLPDSDDYADRAIELYAEAIVEELPDDPLQQRVMLRTIGRGFHRLAVASVENRAKLHDLIREADADPWFVAYLGGNVAMHRAMTSSGAERRRWLERATERAELAIAIRPERPEPAFLMLDVLRIGGPDEAEAREWFDRAIARQIDYAPAYNAYRGTLARTADSPDAFLEFAREALATERFDTQAPRQYIETLERLATIAGGDYDYAYGFPGVFDDMRQLCEGYIAHSDAPRERAYYRSLLIAAAWRCDEIDAAADLLPDDFDELDPAAFRTVGAPLSHAVGHILAHRSDALGPPLTRAEQAADRDNIEQAVTLVRDAVDAHPDAHAWARLFLEHRAFQWRVRRELATGEWVDIQPGPGLAGWMPVLGDWRVEEDGTLVGSSVVDGLLMLLDVPFNADGLLMSAEIELRPHRHESAMYGGLSVNAVGQHRYTNVSLRRDHSAIIVGRGYANPDREVDTPVEQVNQLEVLLQDNRLEARLNDEPLIRGHRIWMQQPAMVGVGADYWFTGGVARYRNLRLRIRE